MKNKKIKVAFFAEILVNDFDGASRTMFQIIERIPKDQFEFLFFCGLGPKKDIGFEVVELPTIRIPFNSTYKMALPFFSEKLISDKLTQFNPDVIHIASPSPLGHFAIDYGKKVDIPVISIYHTHFLSYIDYYLKKFPMFIAPIKNIISKSQKQFYDKCDMLYVPTKVIMNELDQFEFSLSNMKLWQRGIDHHLFNPNKRDTRILQKLTGNENFNILYASRLVWEKNLESLVEVYNKSQKEKLPYNFIIAGSGVAEKELKSRMPNAFFVGKLNHEELATFYASCDTFLFPSISETYGNVVVEAMASGLPCVIANGGGTTTFIENGYNGFVCKVNDSSCYISAIEKIRLDDKLRNQFVNRSLDYVKNLNWESLVNTYFEDLKIMTDMQLCFKTEIVS